jgi:protein-L-isoaspartate O-methyltransferase
MPTPSPSWEGLGPALADAVKGADTSAPALDIGTGSGRGTVVLGRALPGAEIVAVEPSPGLRSALPARVFADAGLRDRVTVLPESVLDAALPDRIGVAVAMNVIGHRRLAVRLVPGGRLVVNLQPRPPSRSRCPVAVAATPGSGAAATRAGPVRNRPGRPR